MIVSTFSILDKNNRERFLEKSFLLTNVKSNIVFVIFFMITNISNVDF